MGMKQWLSIIIWAPPALPLYLLIYKIFALFLASLNSGGIAETCLIWCASLQDYVAYADKSLQERKAKPLP